MGHDLHRGAFNTLLLLCNNLFDVAEVIANNAAAPLAHLNEPDTAQPTITPIAANGVH
jgi:hypothetical protein